MPARNKGARLWLRRARRDRKTGDSHNAVWIIRDGPHTEGTGCRKDDRAGAERVLAEYLNRKHLAQASKGQRDPSQVPIADVLALYGKAKAASQSRPKETAGRIERLLSFFGDKMLCEVNGDLCRAYVVRRSTDAAARRELEDLRAAINYHRSGPGGPLGPLCRPRHHSAKRSQGAGRRCKLSGCWCGGLSGGAGVGSSIRNRAGSPPRGALFLLGQPGDDSSRSL